MPRADEDLALSLALTGREQSPDQLRALSEHIRQGKPIALREEDRQRAVEDMNTSGFNRLLGRDEYGNDLSRRGGVESHKKSKRSIWGKLLG